MLAAYDRGRGAAAKGQNFTACPYAWTGTGWAAVYRKFWLQGWDDVQRERRDWAKQADDYKG